MSKLSNKAGHPCRTAQRDFHRISRRALQFVIYCCLIVTNIAAADEAAVHEAEHHWPQWRGPLSTGVGPLADPPVLWAEDRNVRWKTPLPGRGHSSPIIWADRLFITAAQPVGKARKAVHDNAPGSHDNLPVTHRHAFIVLAVNRDNGHIVWQRSVNEAWPHAGGHTSASLASASPVTDGRRVYAFFGSYGLYCLDLDGQVLWEKQFGLMQSKHAHGEGSSPALYGDTLIVNWDHEDDSFVTALDAKTGETRWQTPRDEPTSWATPVFVTQAGRVQVIVSGTNRIRGYDLETGKVMWACGGLSANVVASPVAAAGRPFAGSSYDTRALLAINLQDAAGDLTAGEHIIWQRQRGTPYVPSPLLYDSSLYFLAHYQNVMTRVDAETGEDRPGPLRLPGIRNVYASPVAAAGRIYVTDLDGATLVITHDDSPRVLSVNHLDDSFAASAALAGREIFLRGRESLYCIAQTP